MVAAMALGGEDLVTTNKPDANEAKTSAYKIGRRWSDPVSPDVCGVERRLTGDSCANG